jgi:hypothetical protein
MCCNLGSSGPRFFEYVGRKLACDTCRVQGDCTQSGRKKSKELILSYGYPLIRNSQGGNSGIRAAGGIPNSPGIPNWDSIYVVSSDAEFQSKCPAPAAFFYS